MTTLKQARKEPGVSMPGGRFPIRDKQDLANAKHDIGRAKGSREAVIRHIDARAKAVGGSPVGGGKKWLSEG